MKFTIKTIGLGLSILLCSANVKAQQLPFTIKISSANAWPNSMVFLSYVKPGDGKLGLDSAKLIDGKALIKSTTAQPQKAFIYIERADKGFIPNYTKASRAVYLEKGNITFSTTRDVVDARIGGTPLNNDLQGYTDVLLHFKPYQDSLSNRFRVAYRDKLSADLDRLNGEFKTLDIAKRKAEVAYFNQKPNSLVSLDWLEQSYNIAQEKAKVTTMFNTLGIQVKKSSNGKAFLARLNKTSSVEVGGIAPDFTAKSVNGEAISLKSFKGKYVLLDFWASWCGPCRKENPNVLKAYNSYKDHNFTVVGFSMDESKKSWENAVKVDGMPWTQLSDLKAWQGAVSKLYGIGGIPCNFLIDPSGKIIARDLRGDKLEQELNRIFKKG